MNRLPSLLLSVVILLSISSYSQNNPPGYTKVFKWNKIVDGQALSVYKYKYEIASEEKIETLINAGDGKYALLVPALSDCTKYAVIYDLGTSRALCGYYRKGTIFRFPWVRDEAFEQFNLCAQSK